jgi:hypothetical protein
MSMGTSRLPPRYPKAPLLFDGLACLAVWGRAAVVAAALILLPTTPALTVALVAHFAAIGLIVARLHH